MGDTARFGGVRASFHGERRDARALRWHRQSSSDNNGTPLEAGDRARLGRRVPAERETFASGVAWCCACAAVRSGRISLGLVSSPSQELRHHLVDVRSERAKAGSVGFGSNPDDDIRGDVRGKDSSSRKLSKASLDSVSGYGRVSEAGNDEADARPRPRRMHERGSADPNLEERGSDTLPLLRDTLQFRASCDARTSRKPKRRAGRVRLRRTCPGCAPSTASVLSSGGGRGSYDPIWFPCAHENRAFSDAACCADDRSAFPWLLQIRS